MVQRNFENNDTFMGAKETQPIVSMRRKQLQNTHTVRSSTIYNFSC